MYHLPIDLQRLIYEFDGTYREQFAKVLLEIDDLLLDPYHNTDYYLKEYYDQYFSFENLVPTNLVQVNLDEIEDIYSFFFNRN
jgi:hypothetical protein